MREVFFTLLNVAGSATSNSAVPAPREEQPIYQLSTAEGLERHAAQVCQLSVVAL